MAVSIYCPFQIILINLFLTVILRLKMLRANIESMRDFDTLDVNKFIRIYVKEHIDIMRNCRFLNDTMKYAMLLEFLITSGELSMFIFIVIMTSSPNSKMFSGACIVNLLVKILILCWHADQIREESIGIADAVYELPWLEYDKSDVTSLQIIMMRSQKPLTLTIGPFGTMTLELAVKIFKATYTYVTFMQNVYGKLD
uniref:Odorant receptor n=2 Tax=Anoplophora chinensis TaxID=217632 RepID=A0A2H4ZBA6_ANOCN|nr:odorant receptor [Anoplophora chinensis]